jgi:hypothetical protein
MTPLHQGRLWPCVQRRTNSASHQYKYSFLLYVCVCVCVSVCGCNESSATYLGRPLKKPHVHACTCSHQDLAVHRSPRFHARPLACPPKNGHDDNDMLLRWCQLLLGGVQPGRSSKGYSAYLDRSPPQLSTTSLLRRNGCIWKPTSRAADEQCKCEAMSCLFH